MANNRLYIVDSETGSEFMLAKSMGKGWYTVEDRNGDPSFRLRLENFLRGKDFDASYGNCTSRKTELKLVTENGSV